MQRIDQLHHGGDACIEAVSYAEVVAHFLNGLVHFTARVFFVFAEVADVTAICLLNQFIAEAPHALKKTLCTRYARIRPLKRLLRRRSKHGVQTHGIGTVLLDGFLWVDTVVL